MSSQSVVKFFGAGLLLCLVGCASTQPTVNMSQYDMEFQAQSSYPAKRIEWIVVDDVNAACRDKFPLTHNRKLLGCAMHNQTQCKVYTSRNTTLSILGHEMRHCFEGHWHR